jgi:hypothetical protein
MKGRGLHPEADMADHRLASLAALGIALASCAPPGERFSYRQPDPASFELVAGGTKLGDVNENVQGARVLASFFTSAGAPAFLGRLFTDEDFAGPGRKVMVLHHALWQSRFEGSPTVIGSTVDVNGEPHTVVGVTPPDFGIPDGVRVWLPRPGSQ